MTNRNQHATHRHSNQPSSSTRPPDVHGTNRAHMCTINIADGSEMTIWYYRVSKQHEVNQPKMSPHEMLYDIALALQREDHQFSIVHQQTGIPVSADEIYEDEDILKCFGCKHVYRTPTEIRAHLAAYEKCSTSTWVCDLFIYF